MFDLQLPGWWSLLPSCGGLHCGRQLLWSIM